MRASYSEAAEVRGALNPYRHPWILSRATLTSSTNFHNQFHVRPVNDGGSKTLKTHSIYHVKHPAYRVVVVAIIQIYFGGEGVIFHQILTHVVND